MSKEDADELAYIQLKQHLVSMIEEYKQKVTEQELNNRLINIKEKASIINAYNQLREIDQIPYIELINSIEKGGSPVITVVADKLDYDIGTQINLYSLIKAMDNEDGPIIIIIILSAIFILIIAVIKIKKTK